MSALLRRLKLRPALIMLCLLTGAVLVLLPSIDALGSLGRDAGRARLQDSAQQAVVTSEVMHWWTSDSEAAAIEVLRTAHRARGGVWTDSPQPSRDELRRSLVDRLASGVAPAAVLWQAGGEIQGMAELGMLRSLDSVAEAQNWDSVLPAAVRDQVRSGGHYYVAPTNVHVDNWAFYNLHALRRYGMTEPRDLGELLADLQRIQALGGKAIAVGAHEWEPQTAMNSILMGTLGTAAYRRLLYQRDRSVLAEPNAVQALHAVETFRDLAKTSAPYASWSDAAKAVARGEAVATFMGDWAKGEMQSAGARVGRDVGCMLTGGRSGPIALTIDGFLFPDARRDTSGGEFVDLAATMMDREVQRQMAIAKRAVAARSDALPEHPDACERLLRARLDDSAAAVQTPPGALGPRYVGRFSWAINRFYRDSTMTREQLREELLAALAPR